MPVPRRPKFWSRQPAPLVLWLTLAGRHPVPKGVQRSVSNLDELWVLLAQGLVKSVMVDRRYKFKEVDAWEVALRIRETYPLLPLAVLTPSDLAPTRKGRSSSYVKQPL